MKVEAVQKIVDKLKGKKAKVKKLDSKPEGTKSAKLPPKLAASMKEVFDVDFSKVKVHTGGNAADIASSLGARAFTVGSDIYLGKPADAGNMKILAHELTHVIHQGGGKLDKKGKAGKAMVSK